MPGGELVLDETLVEMTYRWGDIEKALPRWTRTQPHAPDNPLLIGQQVADAVGHAFRVEASVESGEDDYDNVWQTYAYQLLFDVADTAAREAATQVRSETRLLEKVAAAEFGDLHPNVEVRVCSRGTPAEGQVCGRAFEPPPKRHIDVTDVPIEKPGSNVPLVERDGYWLTPIEVPFYDALRETGLVFAVQPWVQGVQGRYRLDFLVFYDGGMVAVELDGHESHKSKEQRMRDAKRDRWFEARKVRTLRWTGSEVHANADECVRELLEILRGRQARA